MNREKQSIRTNEVGKLEDILGEGDPLITSTHDEFVKAKYQEELFNCGWRGPNAIASAIASAEARARLEILELIEAGRCPCGLLVTAWKDTEIGHYLSTCPFSAARTPSPPLRLAHDGL